MGRSETPSWPALSAAFGQAVIRGARFDRERPRWLVTRSAGWGVGLGALWLLFGLLWVPDLGLPDRTAAPDAAVIGFLISYFPSAWWLRRHGKVLTDRCLLIGSRP
jgi:hypothetical protein